MVEAESKKNFECSVVDFSIIEFPSKNPRLASSIPGARTLAMSWTFDTAIIPPFGL